MSRASRYVFEAIERAQREGLCLFCRTKLITIKEKLVCPNSECRRAPGRRIKLRPR